MCLALSVRVRDEGDLLGYAAAAGIIGAIALYRLQIRRGPRLTPGRRAPSG